MILAKTSAVEAVLVLGLAFSTYFGLAWFMFGRRK